MDVLTAGADIGAMLTGASAVTATYVWTRNQLLGWRERKAASRERNWHGYIMTNGIDDWFVRLAEEPDGATSRVILDVVNRQGQPDANGADRMRQHVLDDGMLCRVPTPAERDFLNAVYAERSDSGAPVL